MRTTLTLDDDVAAALEQMRRENETTFKAVVNETLRAGLRAPKRKARRSRRVAFPTFSLGECLLSSLDCIPRALAEAEGEDYR